MKFYMQVQIRNGTWNGYGLVLNRRSVMLSRKV